MEELITSFSRLHLGPFQLNDDARNADHGIAIPFTPLSPRALTEPTRATCLQSMPVEIVRDIAKHLPMRDTNNLKSTCKDIRACIVGQFYLERQVIWEYVFDFVREWIVTRQDVIRDFITFTPKEVASWPESRADKYANNEAEGAEELFKFLDQCVEVWGAGILYFTYSVFDTFWDKSLVQQLPRYHREGSLINRAISSCRDPIIMEQVMSAYSLYYKDSLDGLKETPVRRRFAGHILNNDAPPVFWACSENRVDVLELLNREDGQDGPWHWTRMDIGRVTDDENNSAYEEDIMEEWHLTPTLLLDAWESAFHPRDAMGRLKPASQYGINEDACVWLIEHNLGFHSRPGGIPIQHLAEAAVLKKARVIEALLKHFRSTLTPKKFQRALTLALQATTRPWIGSRPPRPRPQARKRTRVTYPDGHETVIEILFQACLWWGSFKQDGNRKEDRGILTYAIKYAPRNANYLLKKQIELGITDRRDVRAALLEAVEYCGRGYTQRLQFIGTILPNNVELACDTDKMSEGPDSWRQEVDDLRRATASKIQETCFRTSNFTVALHFANWVGSELFEEWLMKAMTAPQVADEAGQVAR
ncbi:hypothetical protein PG984_013058 [Apiospora sp. TS-2023a]